MTCSAGRASTAWPATLKIAGRCGSRISSSAEPPITCRVTTSGDRPWNDTTLAAIGTSSRAATWASTSLPRGVPAAVTTTDFACARTATITDAQAAAAYDARSGPAGVVQRRDAVLAELLARHVAGIADHQRADRDAAALGGEVAGEA